VWRGKGGGKKKSGDALLKLTLAAGKGRGWWEEGVKGLKRSDGEEGGVPTRRRLSDVKRCLTKTS